MDGNGLPHGDVVRSFNGYVYDTASANLIGQWQADDCEEALYKTTEGKYFIAGHGFCELEIYWKRCRRDGLTWHGQGGSTLALVSKERADDWAEEYLADAE